MPDCLERLGPRHLGKRALGRRVGGNAGEGEIGRVGGVIDDRARLVGHHRLLRFTRMQEGAGDVGLHLPFPFLAAQVDQILAEDAAGIVHQGCRACRTYRPRAPRPIPPCRAPVRRDLKTRPSIADAGQSASGQAVSKFLSHSRFSPCRPETIALSCTPRAARVPTRPKSPPSI